MAGRQAKGTSRQSGSGEGRTRSRPVSERSEPTPTAADLTAECVRLRAELEAAKARIAELETARNEVLDRIAWAIDSLHNLTET